MGLKTVCMGLTLRNPVVVASCGLVRSVSGVKMAAEAGAGAVVLKSVFEEQFEAEAREAQPPTSVWHPEVVDYVMRTSKDLGPEEYVRLVEKAKASVDIPVIASVNCTSPSRWPDYAGRLADAGADALELNLAIFPRNHAETSASVEERYYGIVNAVRERTVVPLAVKLSPHFTSLGHVASRLADLGVSALVLFNRFYRLDVDLDQIELKRGQVFSSAEEWWNSLRWIGLLYGRVGCDLVAGTGIHDGETALKLILVGACAVQVASAIYLHGWERITQMVETMERWLEAKGIHDLDAIRGRLSQAHNLHPEWFERLQYVRALTGME